MPSDFQFKELGIPKSRPWYGIDIFWNCPLNVTALAFVNGKNSGFTTNDRQEKHVFVYL